MDDQVIAAVSGVLSHVLNVFPDPRPDSRQMAELMLRALESTGFYVIQVPDYAAELFGD
jgi:hypothetical protein